MIDTPESALNETMDAREAAGVAEVATPGDEPVPDPNAIRGDRAREESAGEMASSSSESATADWRHPGRSESGVGDIAFIVVFMLAVLFTMKILGRRGGKRVPGTDRGFAERAAELRAMYAANEAAQTAAGDRGAEAAAAIEGKPGAGASRFVRTGGVLDEVVSLRERVATLERLMRRSEARLADLERQSARAMHGSGGPDVAEPGAVQGGVRSESSMKARMSMGVGHVVNDGVGADGRVTVEAKPMVMLSPPPPLGAVRGEILRLAKTGVSERDIAARVGVPESHVRLVTGMSRAAA
jgi:hypothetical protein